MGESWSGWWGSLGPLACALLLSAVLFGLRNRLLHRYAQSVSRRRSLNCLTAGLVLFMWVAALHITSVKWSIPLAFGELASRLFRSAYVLALFFAAYGFFPLFLRLGQKTMQNMGLAGRQSVERVIGLLIKALVVIFGVSALLSVWGIHISQLLTGLGIGSLAVALAAQNLLSNMIGGASLMLDRPFEIGETISVAGFSGKVEEIGWRSTRLRSFEDEWVTLPNAKLMDANIVNLSRMRKRRINFDVSVASESGGAKVAALCEKLRSAIPERPLSCPDTLPQVSVQSLSLGAYKIVVKYYINETDLQIALREKEALLLETADWVRELGLKWPQPEWSLNSERNEHV